MTITVTAAVTFEAGHQLDIPGCERAHGHAYTIEVETVEFRDPISANAHLRDLNHSLAVIKSELVDRSLNEMIEPATPDAIGLASWTNERLSSHPVAEVRVVESTGRAATIRR